MKDDKLSINGAGGVSKRRPTYEELVSEVTRLTSENVSLQTSIEALLDGCDEGMTPADVVTLKDANTALAMESHELQGRIDIAEADMKVCADLINSQSKHIARLAAQVERLRAYGERLADECCFLIDKHNTHNESDNSWMYDHQTPVEFMQVVNETPSESLDALKAKWLEELGVVGCEVLLDGFWYNCIGGDKQTDINNGYQVRNVYTIKGEVE